MRAITKQKWSDRITPIYRRLQVLKINDLYKLETAKFMHQFSDKSLPASFEKYFTRTTFVHCHSTRTSERNDYFLPHFSTTRLQRSIRFSGVKLWNSIFFFSWVAVSTRRHNKLSLHGFPVSNLNYILLCVFTMCIFLCLFDLYFYDKIKCCCCCKSAKITIRGVP